MRPIDADGLKKSIEEDEELKGNSLAYLLMNLMTCYIDEAPTVDAEPVRHGHWIECPLRKYPKEHIDVCSVCDGKALAKYNYCPHCGAKMDERNCAE